MRLGNPYPYLNYIIKQEPWWWSAKTYGILKPGDLGFFLRNFHDALQELSLIH